MDRSFPRASPRLVSPPPNASQAAASATGAMIANTQRHDAASTSDPPTSGPIAVDTADQPAHRPIAVPRSSSLKDASSMARLFGTNIAPADPCTNRSTSNAIEFGASAQPTVATENATAPVTNSRRRPYRSPSAPPSNVNAPSASR